jgi:hypothetical protein
MNHGAQLSRRESQSGGRQWDWRYGQRRIYFTFSPAILRKPDNDKAPAGYKRAHCVHLFEYIRYGVAKGLLTGYGLEIVGEEQDEPTGFEGSYKPRHGMVAKQ